MAEASYIPAYCTSCGAEWKVQVERAPELDAFQLRCADCKANAKEGIVKRTPEYGQPLSMAGRFSSGWSKSSSGAWME